MDYLKHIFNSDFILVIGVFGIIFYNLYDAIKNKKWKWAIFIAIIPLAFISIPLYILFGVEDKSRENRDNTDQTD